MFTMGKNIVKWGIVDRDIFHNGSPISKQSSPNVVLSKKYFCSSRYLPVNIERLILRISYPKNIASLPSG